MNKEQLAGLIGDNSLTIAEALEKIDKNSLGILFITNGDGCLVGTLSDGDIRRWLIRTGNLNATVDLAMNNQPQFVTEEQTDMCESFFEQNHISVLPIVDADLHVVDALNNKWKQDTKGNYKNKLKGIPVVMMAGGKGTRLYPYTKILPKPLIPVGDKPIAELIIESFHEYGCEDYYLIVNHKKNMIKAYFGEKDVEYNIHFVDEDNPLGTGGGVRLLKGLINETFILTNCDNIVEEDYSEIYGYHKEHGNDITMICSMKNFSIPYGVVHLADQGTIKSMEEKPIFSFMVNTGCYIVEPDVIDDIPENTFIGFPDIIEKYRLEGKKVGVYPISESTWLDMGEIDALEKMREHLQQK